MTGAAAAAAAAVVVVVVVVGGGGGVYALLQVTGCADLKDRGICDHERLSSMAKKLCPTACGVCVLIGKTTHDLHKVTDSEVRDYFLILVNSSIDQGC